MIRSHKIRLRPSKEQQIHLHRAFAAARHAWNWGKDILDTEYDLNRIQYQEHGTNYKFTSIITNDKITGQRSLKALYNKIKPDWVKDRTATATPEAFSDLQRALKRYFDIRAGKITIDLKRGENGNIKPRKDGRHHGWLNWRSKRDHNSFRASNVTLIKKLEFGSTEICYSAKIGYIKMCEPLRFDGKIMNTTFSYDGQWYWASVQVEIEKPMIESRSGVVGVDLGIKYLAITSDGKTIENPKSYYDAQAKLRRYQRKLDRQRRANNPQNYNDDGTARKGRLTWHQSGQMKRTDQKIKRLHTRIKNIRRNAQHHLSAEMAQNYGLIVIEDLNVRGMMKNRKLSKAIADAGFYEIRRQLEYKTEPYAGMVGVVDRWFPSSKLCSGCGDKKLDLSLSDRNWICDNCGQHNKRDLNAAINLKNEGIRLFVNPDLSPAGPPVTA